MRKRFLRKVKYTAVFLSLGLMMGLTACGEDDDEDFDIEELLEEDDEDDDFIEEDDDEEDDEDDEADLDDGEFFDGEDIMADENTPTKENVEIHDTKENHADSEHVILADGETAEYSNTQVTKSGNAEGDEADFYGDNAAVLATNKADLKLNNMVVITNGTHANGVFSYGEETQVDISDSVIETTGNCSGGLMTTGGGKMTATNMNIHTSGNSSAAIRSDRGGGTVKVSTGAFKTEGTGSPVVYSTADITVENAIMQSDASEGIVIEGDNSVSLSSVELIANHTTLNSDKSDNHQAVMIYQSMSGDADQGTAVFTMTDSLFTNKTGDIFFVNNTDAVITVLNTEIENEDTNGAFLRVAAAGWGKEGSNGGNVILKLGDQLLNGDIIVDDISTLNMYLTSETEYNGAINSDGKAGDVYVEITGESKWILTDDSYITSLTCDKESIDLNGHKLYVNGTEYKEKTEFKGEPVEAKVRESGGDKQAPPDGDKPDGKGDKPAGDPPAKPDGDDKQPGEEPPAKPDGESTVEPN